MIHFYFFLYPLWFRSGKAAYCRPCVCLCFVVGIDRANRLANK